jgi:ferritin-like metal-binding protein YciE
LSRPHLYPPTDLFLATLSPHLVPIQAELEERLQATRKRNDELVALIQKRREETEGLVGALEAVVGDLESANGTLGPVVGSLREEIMET